VTRWRRPQFLLLVLAVLLLAATFLRPTLELEQATYRYVFVFDISQSMNVDDVPGTRAPITRIEYAKQMTLESLTMLPCGSEAGLALFTGHRAFLLITPVETCANYRELAGIVNNINWRMTWETKSEIAKGVYKSVALLKQLPGDTRLVFFTDGHEAPPINPELPPRFAGEKGEISGLIMGVGGDTPSPIPKYDSDGEQQGYWKAEDVSHTDSYTQQRSAREGTPASTQTGTEHLSSLRVSYLQGIAENTGLSYHTLQGAREFANRMKSPSLGIAKTATTDMRWLLALSALIALIATLAGNPLRKRGTSGSIE